MNGESGRRGIDDKNVGRERPVYSHFNLCCCMVKSRRMNNEQKPKTAATKGEGSRYGGHPSKQQMPIMSGNPKIRHDNLNQSDVRASQWYGRCQGNKGGVRRRTKAVACFLSKQTATSETDATPLDGEQHIRGMVGEDYETRRCDFSKENDIKHGKTHPF